MPEPRLDPSVLVARWAASGGAERANAQPFLADLADALGVDRPHPTTGDPGADAYVFERPLAFQDGTQSKGFIDLYKRGHFVLETKQGADAKRAEGGRRLRQGHGVRHSAAWEAAMDAARGQAEGYARNLEAAEPPPPFVVVCDVGFCVDLYADFSGSGRLYRPFPDAGGHRLPLARLTEPDVRATLAAVFEAPLSLDPTRRQARVTVELARRLAVLAQSLDGAADPDGVPMGSEAVAGFLSRCLFSMFAEDAGLIPAAAFSRLLAAYEHDLDHLPLALGDFFGKMDAGGYVGEARARLRRFNGALFKDARAPRLSAEALALLRGAARTNWSDVEPSIFGTLLERALDPRERHALGAHFTPRRVVERLVGPAVLEPLREEWDGVRAAATRLAEQAEAARAERNDALATRRRNEARAALSAFLTRLASVRVLDPACGSGNFLYVTLAGLKSLEDEARRTAERLVGEAVGEGFGVTPRQMRGIELNARAAAIADLVLWIGYLQWHRARYGTTQPLPEPVLEGYGQVEWRDAVLTPEGTPAPWPEADFIVGNPPFIGAGAMRGALGDGYTERLRRAYPAVPESADLVMFWWERAALAVREGRAERFGLITTNSLGQTFNRRVVARHLGGADGAPDGARPVPTGEERPGRADRGPGGRGGAHVGRGRAPAEPPPPLALAFAVPDHPWTDAADGAAVRVAMTVGVRADRFDAEAGRLARVVSETPSAAAGAGGTGLGTGLGTGEGAPEVELDEALGRIHADLSVGTDVTQAEALEANRGLSNRGICLVGQGFVVTPAEAEALGLGRVDGLDRHVRPYLNGKDLTTTPRGVLVIDLFGLRADEVRERFPEVYEHLLRTVKPERDLNKRPVRRDNWWLLGESQPRHRQAVGGLRRYIATSMTAKHRLFTFVAAETLPDQGLVAIALDDAFHLGVLSSRTHEAWALAAGGRLGVGNDPRYNNSRTFEPFPFPEASPETGTGTRPAEAIRALGEAIDGHRKARQAAHPGLGLTDLYNAALALRAGRALTAKEASAGEAGLAHTLLDLHRRLDRAVLAAYGWGDLDAEAPGFAPAVLARLVALNAARRAEEGGGTVRYLRPSFQSPASTQGGLDLPAASAPAAPPSGPSPRPWPEGLPARTVAVRQAVQGGARTVEAVAARFSADAGRPGPRRAEVSEVLDTLAALGLVRAEAGGLVA